MGIAESTIGFAIALMSLLVVLAFALYSSADAAAKHISAVNQDNRDTPPHLENEMLNIRVARKMGDWSFGCALFILFALAITSLII